MPAFDWENNVCFVCGTEGSGLKLQFSGDAGEVMASAVIHPPYEGFAGIVHGGILASLMDDAMWHVIHQQHNDFPVTAELKVRYRAPARIGEVLTVRGRLISYNRRMMRAEATIESGGGTIIAYAEGRFMPASLDEGRRV